MRTSISGPAVATRTARKVHLGCSNDRQRSMLLLPSAWRHPHVSESLGRCCSPAIVDPADQRIENRPMKVPKGISPRPSGLRILGGSHGELTNHISVPWDTVVLPRADCPKRRWRIRRSQRAHRERADYVRALMTRSKMSPLSPTLEQHFAHQRLAFGSRRA